MPNLIFTTGAANPLGDCCDRRFFALPARRIGKSLAHRGWRNANAAQLMKGGTLLNSVAPVGSIPWAVARQHLQRARSIGR